MTRPASLLALALLASLCACKKDAGETTPPAHQHGGEHHGDEHSEGDLEGRAIVDNWEAKTGDVTTCPMSGKKFEVKDDSGRYDYKGHNFVFCCTNCLEKVEADPGKYLDALVERAGGPADSEPAEADPAEE